MKRWMESGEGFWAGSCDKSRARKKYSCLKEERGIFISKDIEGDKHNGRKKEDRDLCETVIMYNPEMFS